MCSAGKFICHNYNTLGRNNATFLGKISAYGTKAEQKRIAISVQICYVTQTDRFGREICYKYYINNNITRFVILSGTKWSEESHAHIMRLFFAKARCFASLSMTA